MSGSHCRVHRHWKRTAVMTTTLSCLMAPEVVVMTSHDATRDNKFCIMTTLVSQWITTISDALHHWNDAVTLACCIILRKHKKYFTIVYNLPIIYRPWDSTVRWNPPSWTTGVCYSTASTMEITGLGLALLTLSWDKNWDSHSLVNGYLSFYPRIALVAPSPGDIRSQVINSHGIDITPLITN